MNMVLGQCFWEETAIWGNDINKTEELFFNRVEKCQAACHDEPKCNVWSYSKETNRCYLKTTISNDVKKDVSFISGPKNCWLFNHSWI